MLIGNCIEFALLVFACARIGALAVILNTRLKEEEEVRSFVREHLADYKVPAAVEFIAELPRNPGGKIIKSYLKQK